MPSYRIAVGVGTLRAGVDPQAVIPDAAAAARTVAVVEAADLAIVRGAARVTVRFTADDDDSAAGVAALVVDRLAALATVESIALTRREGTRWYPVR